MDKLSIVNETPRAEGLSLKWKWALGSAAGVFLIFIIFSIFLVTAFSNSMIQTERKEVRDTLQTVSSRLHSLKATQMLPAEIDKSLQPKEGLGFQETLQDPVLMSISRDDTVVRVYNNAKAQVYPLDGQRLDVKLTSHQKISTLFKDGQEMIIGQIPLYDKKNQRIGTVVIENQLADYNQLFKRIYAILAVLITLGLILIALWGYWLADYLLRPVTTIEQVVNDLQADPQSQSRVPIPAKHHDELTALSQLMNTTLHRMQDFILAQHQFVEDVSHELRTPVAIVKGHMELLNRWGKDDPKILEESIQASLQEMSRMQGLVQEMLDLTRADQVEITFRDGKTDAKEVMNAVFNNFKMIHQDFLFGLDDSLSGPTDINMSRDHLEQILIVLSDNAVKYSQTRKEIHYAIARTSTMVQIAVQDFGEGISEEDAKHVFDRFYRVDKARSRKQGGNGLGLSIAQKLVEGYGGRIELESSLGNGSIFRLSLPIKVAKK